jgi:hypothetical protein
MDNEETRRKFLAYFTQFRLIQLHVFNVVFAYLNGVWASPSRVLTFQDFMAGLTIAIVYMVWYLLVLDRLGIHLYPIFSPRSPWAVVTWVLVISGNVGGFFAWKAILAPDA